MLCEVPAGDPGLDERITTKSSIQSKLERILIIVIPSFSARLIHCLF